MAFQKFRADQLFDGYHLLDDQQVLVMHEDGRVQEIVALADAGDDIRLLSGILTPGFINCHCHLELSHMKALIPEDTGLIGFVFNVMQQRHFPEQEILTAIGKAEDEMVNNGIVAVGDICNNTFSLAQKRKGRMSYHNFVEVAGFNPSIATQRFQRALDFYREYEVNGSMSMRNSIVPHAPYSVADELWDEIIHFPNNHLLTIHNQETEGENELFMQGTGDFLSLYGKMGIDISFFRPSGKSSLRTFLPKLSSRHSLVLVHNVHTSEQDLQYCFNGDNEVPQLSWCLCPNANLYISGKLPNIELLSSYSDRIVFGTDSLASNHALSILAEMKTVREHFSNIGLEQLFRWATINGALALEMQDELGSFEPGKKPGVVLCDKELLVSQRLL
jgi:cytosine/adenosine deaminase-related metal-dependent hydrolase